MVVVSFEYNFRVVKLNWDFACGIVASFLSPSYVKLSYNTIHQCSGGVSVVIREICRY